MEQRIQVSGAPHKLFDVNYEEVGMPEQSLPSEDARAITAVWWVAALVGAMSIIVVVKPSNSLATLAVISGIFVLIDPIAAIVEALGSDGEHRGLVAILGIVRVVAVILAIAGIAIVSSPHIGYATLALIVGVGFIAYGAAMIVLGLAIRTLGHAAAPPAARIGPLRHDSWPNPLRA